jgi:ribose transport system substrate-binding protein
MFRSTSAAALRAAVALSLVAVAAAACSSGAAAGSGGSAGSKNLELIVGTKSDNFYVTMECGAQQEAKALGVNLTVTGPADFTVPEQKPLIDAAISTKPDALLVAPTDTTALDSDLQRVQGNGTKVVFVDTSSSDSSLGVARITSNNAQGGQLAADQLAALVGGKGTVAVVTVKAGTSTTDARVQGFVQEMKTKFPGIKLLPTQYDDLDSTSVATSDIEGDVAGNPDLSGVFAANVVTAEGAATAIQATKMSGKVKVATFDADPTQMTMLQNGTIQLAIAQAPSVEGKDAVDQAVDALTGKPVTASILTPLVAITKSNMSDASVKPYIYESSCS